MEKTGILEESPGVMSSKRVAGFIMFGAGASLLIAVGVIAIFRLDPMPNASITITAASTLLVTGAGTLGVTVLEGLGKVRQQ